MKILDVSYDYVVEFINTQCFHLTRNQTILKIRVKKILKYIMFCSLLKIQASEKLI